MFFDYILNSFRADSHEHSHATTNGVVYKMMHLRASLFWSINRCAVCSASPRSTRVESSHDTSASEYRMSSAARHTLWCGEG